MTGEKKPRVGRRDWEIGKLTGEKRPRARSICGDFFGSNHDAAGVIMAVAHQQIHALVHGNHQTANFGQLFADGAHLLFEALDPRDAMLFNYANGHETAAAGCRSE